MSKKNANDRQIRDSGSITLTAVKYVVLTIGALVMMFPFIWMLLTSLKTLPEAISIPPQWMPSDPQWVNYEYSWNLVPFGMFFRNTIWVGILSVVVTLVLSILGAYAFSIYSFPGHNLCFYLFMLTMMVPNEILIIQNYVTCSKLGMLDSFSGIVLPTVANGFYIFMLQEYFLQTPPSLFKAAKVDGCSNLKYLIKVVIPMNVNAIVTVAILTFITAWNSFMWPLIVTMSDEHTLLSVGLLRFRQASSSNLHNQMAAACIVLIPMVVFYIIFHKKIMEGVASGGTKG
ncbi:MAG: carbohydrate ABC transporter permease [Oscillospiraceae bacterium]|nr:carbohydrate ABC transporter permease [Oscillospiraceae bacterium]